MQQNPSRPGGTLEWWPHMQTAGILLVDAEVEHRWRKPRHESLLSLAPSALTMTHLGFRLGIPETHAPSPSDRGPAFMTTSPDRKTTEPIGNRPEPLRPRSPLQRPSPFQLVLRRVLSGVLFMLPAMLTLLVIYQIYLFLNRWIIAPVAMLIIPSGIENPYWTAVEKYVAAPLSLLAVFAFLYLMGYLFQTRLHRWVHWIFERIPGVSTLYKAINEVSQALQGPDGFKKIDTVVLVPFPSDQSRMVGYLMGESRDEATGEQLACVYVPLGIFPPSGYTLVMRADQITVTDWKATAPWKVLLSGGLTLPEVLPFHKPKIPDDTEPAEPDQQ